MGVGTACSGGDWPRGREREMELGEQHEWAFLRATDSCCHWLSGENNGLITAAVCKDMYFATQIHRVNHSSSAATGA